MSSDRISKNDFETGESPSSSLNKFFENSVKICRSSLTLMNEPKPHSSHNPLSGYISFLGIKTAGHNYINSCSPAFPTQVWKRYSVPLFYLLGLLELPFTKFHMGHKNTIRMLYYLSFLVALYRQFLGNWKLYSFIICMNFTFCEAQSCLGYSSDSQTSVGSLITTVQKTQDGL